MFENPVKNRMLTCKERSEDLQDSIIWDRYPRTYLLEKHFYKNMPITPKVPYIPTVKFDLGYFQ